MSTPRPIRFDAMGGLVTAVVKPDRRATGRRHLVNAVNVAQLDMIIEFEIETVKGPFQPRPVEQNIRPGVKPQPLDDVAGSQATGTITCFKHLHLISTLCQVEGCRQPTHSGADHNEFACHMVLCHLRV